MVIAIRNKLLTGSIKNVSVFGASNLPSSPYVVIIQRKDPLGRGIIFTINAHYPPDYQIQLEDYVRNELVLLLDEFTATTRNGNYKVLEILEDETQVRPVINDDGTISMSRSFLSPSQITF